MSVERHDKKRPSFFLPSGLSYPSFLLLFSFILFYYYSLNVSLLSKRDRQGVDLDRRGGREELGEVEEMETTIKIYFMKKKIYFQYLKKRG